MAHCRRVFLLLIISVSGWAQVNRYVVFFKDKVGTPYVIGQPQAFLSQRAIDRRNRLTIPVTTDDLPVTPDYITQVKGMGANTYFTSRWRNAVLVEADPSVITSIAGLPFVSGAEFVAPGHKLMGGRIKQVSQHQSIASAEVTDTQLKMLSLDKMHSEGFHGEGIMMSILDAGFLGVNTSQPFQGISTDGRLKMTQDFITNSGNVYQFHDHGTKVFSVISALLPGQFTGGAYQANYLLFVTEDVSSEYRIEEYNWLFAAEKADSAGTDIIQSSLGYNIFDDQTMNYKTADLNGKTSVISQAASQARDRGILVVVSAGNQAGWPYISMPADVDGVLAVGAVNASGARLNFSSYGPTVDGRIKPDVVALGLDVSVVLPNGSLGTDTGTSLASPLVASLAAGLIQAFPELKPADIVQLIKESASQSMRPDNFIGYGIPNFMAAKNYEAATRSLNDVSLFPNPVSDVLRLSFKKLPEGQTTLTFYDVQGRQLSTPVVTLDWFNNPLELPVSNLSAGIYLIKIQTVSTLMTIRFVKL